MSPTQRSSWREFIDAAPSPGNDTRALYIDLIKRAVCNLLYRDRPLYAVDEAGEPRFEQEFDLARRLAGTDFPSEAHALIGYRRLTNIEQCIAAVLEDNVAGDLVEAGVYRGGTGILMQAMLKAHGEERRRVVLCDAFLGGTPPSWRHRLQGRIAASIRSRGWQRRLFHIVQARAAKRLPFPQVAEPSDRLISHVMLYMRRPQALPPPDKTGMDSVKANFAAYGLLDDAVVFVPGFFAETLPAVAIDRVALLHLDADVYESTIAALTCLYPKLAPGGFCVVDDYSILPDCRRAVDEYRSRASVTEPLVAIDRIAVQWRKSKES